MQKYLLIIFSFFIAVVTCRSQTITIDASQAGRQQIIDGFGTCLSGTSGEQTWMQNLYFNDAGCSIVRMDLVPRFVSPYSDNSYNSPWFHNNPPLPGPDGNNVRTYTDASDYTRLFNDTRAQIAVMGPDINENILKFDLNHTFPRVAGAMAQAGISRKVQLGDFKMTASIWSPAPWLKISSGNTYNDPYWYPGPYTGTPYPFIWYDNFVGGRLDVSGTPRAEFFDGVENTSALTQFARSTAAYIKGIQDTYGFTFYSISIQNELNFETFYNSCTYPLSSQYIAALKAVRQEFDKYDDLKNIKIMGPEDLLGNDAYGMWEYGGPVHKNLQYLTELAKDLEASNIVDYFCIHGYASDGVNSAGSNSTLWDWWRAGWTTSPAPGIPADVKGFTAYNKKSWMTETSGENPAWLSPATGFPNNGGFSIALKIHQALTNGRESAWIYWQFADGSDVEKSTLTDGNLQGSSPKYVAFKHFSKYIRPNAIRVSTTVSDVANIQASSYVHDADQSLAVVIVNSNSTAQTVTVNVPDLPFQISSFDAYTSGDNNYWQNSTLSVDQQQVSITVPGYGVTTLYGQGTQSIALRDPENPANTESGLDYKYYEGTWSVLPDFTMLSPVKSGVATSFDLSQRLRDDNFAFVYEGFIDVPEDGLYTFFTSSDDGSRLYIGNKLIVDNDGLHGLIEQSGEIGLKAGKHAIRIEFFEATGGQSLSLSYSGPGITKTTVSSSAFYREVEIVTNIQKFAEKAFYLFPNPASSSITVKAVNGGKIRVKILSPSGQVMHEQNGGNQLAVSLSELKSGLYFVEISDGENMSIEKLIKE